ncbi:MAG: outer membrane protein assembly factor BamD, partial [Muribaculaceae bacterium]|nr:outer membrane protein assembly factor BamD [Muribaculaceae bacterium]
MKHRFLIILSLLAILSGCGEYNKVLKSYDYNLKYDYAKKAFENKKYTQAYTILADLVPIFKGTEKGEECLYLLGLSYYENHDYLN